MERINAAVITCSPRGAELAMRLRNAEAWSESAVWMPERYCEGQTDIYGYESLAAIMPQLITQHDCLVFICAAGIAVRMLAPYLQDKYTDPAVIVCDEGGNYAISLLSGHMGGANLYTQMVADALQAQAVITTATDVQHVFAVDSWAREQKLLIGEKHLVKEISARILQGKPVGFYSDIPYSGKLPQELVDTTEEAEFGICVSEQVLQPFGQTLHLMPQNLVLGVGCRSGITSGQLEEAFQRLVQQEAIQPERICAVATIDLKQHERGLLDWIHAKKLPLKIYSSEQLAQVKGEFTPSEFVQSVTGVDNVCERSAALASESGTCAVAKQKLGGITMAVYKKKKVISF